MKDEEFEEEFEEDEIQKLGGLDRLLRGMHGDMGAGADIHDDIETQMESSFDDSVKLDDKTLIEISKIKFALSACHNMSNNISKIADIKTLTEEYTKYKKEKVKLHNKIMTNNKWDINGILKINKLNGKAFYKKP